MFLKNEYNSRELLYIEFLDKPRNIVIHSPINVPFLERI